MYSFMLKQNVKLICEVTRGQSYAHAFSSPALYSNIEILVSSTIRRGF
jgi:hypothetical protein